MKTPDMTVPAPESHPTYRIEHLPGLDVVLNLDHPDQRRVLFLLAFLKRYSNGKTGDEKLFDFDLLTEGSQFVDEDGEQLFFFSKKRYLQINVDFILGRIKKDPLGQGPASDIDTKGRYALESVLNEISLSQKIKQIVASKEAQQLAQKHGFNNFVFLEPLAAFVNRKSRHKFLVYRHIMSGDFLDEDFHLPTLVPELKKIFLAHGIRPNDLRSDQFMIKEEDGKVTLILIDVEAYTENKGSTDSLEIEKPSH